MPLVELSEIDEKSLFDHAVKLKFGNADQQKHILTNVLPQLFADFPIDVFFQRSEIVETLTTLLASSDDILVHLALHFLRQVYTELRIRLC